MSEERAIYKTDAFPASLEALRNRPCLRQFADGYEPPSPEEIDLLIKSMGWSQTQTAKLVGAAFNPQKGSQTIRKWRAPVGSKEHRDIPYSAWRLMLIFARLASAQDDLRQVIS